MDLSQGYTVLAWRCACLLRHYGDADYSFDGDRHYEHVLPSQPRIKLQASRQRLIALPARTLTSPINEHVLCVHSWCPNWALGDLNTSIAATSTPPRRKCRDQEMRAWVVKAVACMPLARTTSAYCIHGLPYDNFGQACKRPLRSSDCLS